MMTTQKIMFNALVLLSLTCSGFSAEAPARFQVGELTFIRPPSWKWVPVNSSMRKAQLQILDDKSTNLADLVFFHGIGGGVQANVERWLAQFQESKEKINPQVEKVTRGKWNLSYVQAEGTYLSGMPGGPKTAQPNSALFGAIIECASGDIFIRLTGPSALVKSACPDLKKTVEKAIDSAPDQKP